MLLRSPSHQQSWQWLCRLNESFFPNGKISITWATSYLRKGNSHVTISVNPCATKIILYSRIRVYGKKHILWFIGLYICVKDYEMWLTKSKSYCVGVQMRFRHIPPTNYIALNPLWPSDAVWWHRSGSTLLQVMACCLMALGHFLIQCCLIHREVL